MAAPTLKTDLEKNLDCLEHRLDTKLNHAMGWRTNRVAIDRDGDPRMRTQDLDREYREKCALITINVADAELNMIGGTATYTQIIHLWCLRALTKDEEMARKRIGACVADLKTDLVWLLNEDNQFMSTRAEMHALHPESGYDKMSCRSIRVKNFASGPVTSFPESFFIAIVQLEYTEFGQRIHL